MKRTIVLFILGFALIVGGSVLAGLAIYASLPSVNAMKGCMTTEMFKVSLCPKDGSYVPLNQISPYLRHAIIMSEDGSFYSHNGFDLDEIKQSFARNLEEGHYTRGGSTITQQLVKNVFLSKDKTLIRKLKEAFLTRQVEAHFTKDQIFERYLNVVQFGKNMYGVKAAAHFYFHKEPASLNVLESAFIAMLLPNPIKYASSFHQGQLTRFARGRIRTITKRLHAVSKITDAEYETALAQLDAFPWNRVIEDPIAEGDDGNAGAKISTPSDGDGDVEAEDPAEEPLSDEY